MVDPKDTKIINSSITEILNNALSHEKTIRQESESNIETLVTRNFPEFLFNLATVLADESQQTKIRQMASTIIKKLLIFSSELINTWKTSLDPSIKQQIKNLVLSTLATQYKEVRSAAALVIATICKNEQPLSEKWPNLIPTLSQSAFNENKNIKLASIESLGFICEELTTGGLNTISVDEILNAIIQNLTHGINDVDIVKASLKAFYHVIKHARKNFSKPVSIIFSLLFYYYICYRIFFSFIKIMRFY